MNWHIVIRFGPEDVFTPDVPVGAPVLVLHLEGGDADQQVRTNCLELMEEGFGRRPGGAALDVLLCAIGVYCADMCVSREQTTVDRWTRSFTLHLPVADLVRWQGVSGTLVRMLRFLTGDEWLLALRPRESQPGQVVLLEVGENRQVCLFSGGLDSTTGAVDLLAAGHHVTLIGHYGAGMTHTFQEQVLGELQAEFPDAAQPLFIHLQAPHLPDEVEHENTARSRSLLFIALGLAAAELTGEGTAVWIPENGLISLNVPMTATRSGSLSTRTTHPHFIGLFQAVLGGLGIKHPLQLPYRFRTKGEMLQDCENAALMRRLTPLTMSCAHPENVRWEGGTPGTHCGHCLPCLVRRAAVLAAGFPDASYQLDVRTHPPSADSERGRDFRALAMAMERIRAMPGSQLLFEVLNGGPLPADMVRESVAVYRRGMGELQGLLQGG
jgi:7-cyano-7-deazaguanine synthase in queuosine biosynthesis